MKNKRILICFQRMLNRKEFCRGLGIGKSLEHFNEEGLLIPIEPK